MGLDMFLRAKMALPSCFRPTPAVAGDIAKFGERYYSGYAHAGDTEKAAYAALLKNTGLTEAADPEHPGASVVPTETGYAVSACVAYWRKANAIHAWFVREVQGGEDECNPHEVARDQLEELRRLCNEVLHHCRMEDGHVLAHLVHEGEDWEAVMREGKVLADPEPIADLLPTQQGFFFGTTEYDEYYVRDIRDTLDMLDRVLSKAPAEATFEYCSSW